MNYISTYEYAIRTIKQIYNKLKKDVIKISKLFKEFSIKIT